jgi:hypothetical protein
MQVRGDTIVDGRNCKFVFQDSQTKWSAILCEEGRKVYRCWPGCESSFELLYDFGCSEGDIIPLSYGEALVTKVELVEQNGKLLRRIETAFRPENDRPFEEPSFCWVEGIGGSMDLFTNILKTGNYFSFVSCEQGSETLYDWHVFSLPSWNGTDTGIDDKRQQNATPPSSSAVYNLQGCRLNRHNTKGIIVSGARKVVVR